MALGRLLDPVGFKPAGAPELVADDTVEPVALISPGPALARLALPVAPATFDAAGSSVEPPLLKFGALSRGELAPVLNGS